MRRGSLLLIAGCLALGMLYARSASIDVAAHQDYDRTLQVVETLDTRLSQDVLRLRYGLLGHYDGLVDDLARLERVEERLLAPPAFLASAAQAALRAATDEYAATADTKADLVERFKSTNAALRSSLRYFPVAARQLVEAAPPLVARSGQELFEAVLVYEVSGQELDRERARASLERLEALGAEQAGIGAPHLESTLLHARNLLVRRAEMESLLQQIDTAPTLAALAVVKARYREAYAAAHLRSEQFRWLLFLFGAFTVGGTVHALRALARAKTALERANDDLDRRVRDRTAELRLAKDSLELDAHRLSQLNEELERSNRELDDFAYIASHDLKEPLRGIHNYACFLIEDYGDRLDDEGRSKLETLGRLAKRMDSLIETLLHFSRVGRTELACGETDIQEAVEEVVESLQISLEERGVEVRIPETLPSVHCDRVRVTEVFRNLISNALKYNDKPDKWVEIGFSYDGDETEPGKQPPRFHVRDNGIGIREKHLDSVFRIFKRLHGRDKFGGGSGAGLTIVKKIVERHGGQIRIESAYGEGTTFHFDFGGAEHV